MDAAEMPAADAPILAALRLPPYYAISASLPRPHVFYGGEGRGEGAILAQALIQLRVPNASRNAVRQIAQQALNADPGLRARLLLNGDVDLARELSVSVHLKAAQLRELHARPLPRTCWIGASCHDAEELELAAELGADFATLSPVCATASHPDTTPLGWERFAQLVADARLPVYALGGVGPDDLERARAAGAQGIAGIRAFRQ
jgi:8-oxo-dGTP diphosphatase